MNIFTPNHVQLLNACFPPTSALLTSGPGFNPNSQELSKLTYYALNHPAKLTKLGSELDKRIKYEARKAQAGNMRSRVLVLMTLAVYRALATECRRDIALLSPSLMSSIDAVMLSLSQDLEVAARAASVFTAWTTYTDGHLVGADAPFTQDYLSVTRRFSELASSTAADHELRNRTRLVGFAAVMGALTSEALYNDSAQFREQVSILVRPVLVNILQADLGVLNEQAHSIKESPMSPYLAEFRTRPTMERRAASIHMHIDGDKGPSSKDVSNAALHALLSLLDHVNGGQLGYIMRSSFDNLDSLNGWIQKEHCSWLAQKTADWARYQYRYAVPTWLVERLLESQESTMATPQHTALVSMITTVFSSPTPLINLSTSDIITNLITFLIQRTHVNANDALLPALVECISSLGCHVYYADQIQDLAGELISRLTTIEAKDLSHASKPEHGRSRAESIRCLLAGLLGLIISANKHEPPPTGRRNSRARSPTMSISSGNRTSHEQDVTVRERVPRRTRVLPAVWQDTLSLLCDPEYAVRADYTEALKFYISNEMPKDEEPVADGSDQPPQAADDAVQQATILRGSDGSTKLVQAVHAYCYLLATTSGLERTVSPQPSPSGRSSPSASSRKFDTATSEATTRRSYAPVRGRKMSVVYRLLDRETPRVTASTSACLSDYAHILDVQTALHRQTPVRALLTSVPALLAIANTTETEDAGARQHVAAIHLVLAELWLRIAKIWQCDDLVKLAEAALSTKPAWLTLPTSPEAEVGMYHSPREPVVFPNVEADIMWHGVDAQSAIMSLISSANVQRATGMDQQGLLRRLGAKWTADAVLLDSVDKSSTTSSIKGDDVSPLLKITPALLRVENNMSIASLARSTRGVGVTDLREALEGRNSITMSSSALVKPASVSTADHGSSVYEGGSRLTPSRSRTRPKRAPPTRPGEVRDVLSKLGIGKQNASLLKSTLQRPDQRQVTT
ncbi:hypothetical protein BD626DRAFT_564571 [Schizophyllum amplum]|uniref:Protein EFR3 n=1 Tax=Schizophyllum amplum TaxID=97359 RepID=A0A550CS86_9AGAR|nr:hypothetical protein BD626DRAFT_564571 [Auriculariopsis ampla]